MLKGKIKVTNIAAIDIKPDNINLSVNNRIGNEVTQLNIRADSITAQKLIVPKCRFRLCLLKLGKYQHEYQMLIQDWNS